MLRGLGLVLFRAVQVGDYCHVDEQAVFASHFQRNLAHGLDERLRFDIAYGAAYFGYDHVGVGMLAHIVYEFFYFVGDVRDDLYGVTQIFAAAFFVEHVPVYFTGCEVGILVQVFVYKTLVMPQIEVGLGAVFGDIDFAVLIRAHGPGVDVYIRVELLRRDF